MKNPNNFSLLNKYLSSEFFTYRKTRIINIYESKNECVVLCDIASSGRTS